MRTIRIRAATADDWPAIWRFMRPIVTAGETFSWDRDIAEEEARTGWCHEPPGRTVVAVDEPGTVVGTAELEPNHDGPGRAHRDRQLHGRPRSPGQRCGARPLRACTRDG